MLKIFKGDDTGGTLGKRVAITVVTELTLTGCVIVFDFCGVRREFEDVSSGDEVEVFFSHNDTRSFPLGTHCATLSVRDSAGKIRTLTNTLQIKVTNNITECYGTDAQSATVTIRNVVNWDDIADMPFEGKTINLRNDNEVLAALGTIVEKLGGTVNA